MASDIRSNVDVNPTKLPDELKEIGITEHLGGNVDINDLHFADEAGEQVKLAKFIRPGHPVILSMVYYECPNLCNFLLNGLVTSLKQLDWRVGDQFDVISVSINPRETSKLAAAKKHAYINSLGDKAGNAQQGWHFLTGSDDQIHKLASEVGFGYRWDPQEQQYAHAAAIYVLTPEGKISRYLYGIDFRPRDLKLALTEASDGKIGNVIDRFVLFCYHFDPKTKKYSMVVMKVMQAGGFGTMVFFGGYLAVFWNGQRRRSKKEKREPETTSGNSKGA